MRCSEPNKNCHCTSSWFQSSDEGSCLKDQVFPVLRLCDFMTRPTVLTAAPYRGFIFNMEQTHYSMICKHNTMSGNISCCFFTDMGNSYLSGNVEDCVRACAAPGPEAAFCLQHEDVSSLFGDSNDKIPWAKHSGFRMITRRMCIFPFPAWWMETIWLFSSLCFG